MREFLSFLEKRLFIKPDDLWYNDDICTAAFNKTCKDVMYHFPDWDSQQVKDRIISNKNELAMFLYRLGNEIYKLEPESKTLDCIHWLMKDLCGCEIYYSSEMGEGFYINHGEGTILGSRVKAGKGLRIYQNVTIGHKFIGDKSNGAEIGDNVVVYAGAKILGNIKIGGSVTVAANSVVTKDVESDRMVLGANKVVVKE